MVMAMSCKQNVTAWMICLTLAEFMLKWRWQSALPNESLNCSLKMLLDY